MSFQVKITPFGNHVVLEIAVGPCKGQFIKNMDAWAKKVEFTADIEEARKFDNAPQATSALIDFSREASNLLAVYRG